MSFFSTLNSWFKRIFRDPRVTEALITITIPLVKAAATKFLDNDMKREWVVNALIAKRIPEGLARMAVEIAYSRLRDELDKLPDPKLKTVKK